MAALMGLTVSEKLGGYAPLSDSETHGLDASLPDAAVSPARAPQHLLLCNVILVPLIISGFKDFRYLTEISSRWRSRQGEGSRLPR